MSNEQQNIFPVFEHLLQRIHREQLLRQKSCAIWMTGLSGSGKTTLAIQLEKELHRRGFLAYVIDGDNIRSGINSDLGFSDHDRQENIRRIAEITKLFVDAGIITINCFISPLESLRRMAAQIIGEKDFIEVYINAPPEICEKRDVKGLYARARKGEIPAFTGISAPFEKPLNPHIEINTADLDTQQSLTKLLDYLLPRIQHHNP